MLNKKQDNPVCACRTGK